MTRFPYSKVTVTGGGGFLGRYVVERLRRFPHVDVFAPSSRDFNLLDAAQVRLLFETARPELVIHLAAVVGGIGHNLKNPGRFLHENLLMGAHLIEQARLSAVRKVVALGSVCSYPKFTPVPFKEEDLWNGYPEETNAPYGLAKRMLLAQLQAYRQQYGLHGIFLLPANLYGPRDNFDLETAHVIAALIRKCVTAKREGRRELEVWGTGVASREFLFVEDCAEGVVRAAAEYEEALPINLGTGREIVIRDLVDLIVGLTGFHGEIVWKHDKPDGQPRRCLDTSKALSKFGFTAHTNLEVGLKRTIAWYETQT